MAASSFKMLQIAKKIDRTADEQKQNEKKKYGPGVTGSVAVCPDSFFQPTVFPLKGGGEASRRSRATVWVAQNQLESDVASERPFLHNYLLPLGACHALSCLVMAHHGLLHFGQIRPRSVLSYRGYTS